MLKSKIQILISKAYPASLSLRRGTEGEVKKVK